MLNPLLEPMKVEVITPDDTLRRCDGRSQSKEGRAGSQNPRPAGNQKINAQVPMSEMLTYANQLHSLTSGRGLYSMEFSHYEELPSHLTQKIIAEREAQKKEKAEEK
jgi:elongation factor G